MQTDFVKTTSLQVSLYSPVPFQKSERLPWLLMIYFDDRVVKNCIIFGQSRNITRKYFVSNTLENNVTYRLYVYFLYFLVFLIFHFLCVFLLFCQ
jgi:hypothetical protein